VAATPPPEPPPAVVPLQTPVPSVGTAGVAPILEPDELESSRAAAHVPAPVKESAPLRPEAIEVQKGASGTGKVPVVAVSESPASLALDEPVVAPAPAAPAASKATREETDALVEQIAALTGAAEKAEKDETTEKADKADKAEKADKADKADKTSKAAAKAPAKAAKADEVADPAPSTGEAEPVAPAAEGEEPINRGLLLKFLSSVRT
jgi:hypothetical protein